jgi:CelD/BcsL family acetyltransferase involved in cellulose biosynthesis
MRSLVDSFVAPPEVRSLADFADLAALRAEWNECAARVPGTSYFQTGDWVVAWWLTVAGRTPTKVACWRDSDGRLRALAAVSRGRELLHHHLGLRVPVLRIAGTGPGDADHCGALAPPELRDDVAGWMASVARRETLVSSGGASNAAVAALLPKAHHVGRVTCPRLDLRELGPGRVARSANFRSQLGRYGRRLARAGVELAWLPPGNVDGPTLDAAYRLHREVRNARGLRSSLHEGHRRLLLRCAGYGTHDRGVAAVVARRHGHIVGALVGFWFDGTFAAYQAGWDPAYAGSSIGSVLVSYAIEKSRASGAHTFDFLRGDEAYKYRFGARDAYDHSYVIPRGWAGRMLLLRAAWRDHVQREANDSANKSPTLAASA